MRRPRPLFADRVDAGRKLAGALGALPDDAVIVGLARGGAVIAAELARALGRPLDVLAVRKIGHPEQPEYAVGAVAPRGKPYIRGRETLTSADMRARVAAAASEAESLDAAIHANAPAIAIDRRAFVLVDDGLATGATMQAAANWARGAREITIAVPVGARRTVAALKRVVDRVVCLESPRDFLAVGLYYDDFAQVADAEVTRLLEQHRALGRDDGAADHAP